MIEGTWKLIGGEQDGQEEPEKVAKNATLEIVGDQHTVTIGDVVRKGTHKVDTSQTPMTIDVSDTAGPYENMALKGIFKVEDDVFTACFGAPDGERPTEFTTKDGYASFMHVWKREE